MTESERAGAPAPQPWWKFGHVWMILAGPLVVVVAGFVTLYLAMRTPDPVVTEDYYRKGIELNKTLEADPSALAPAVQARNHAATGLPPAVKATDKP
jgi:hypothetical protein